MPITHHMYHETCIRSCKGYPYPAGFFSFTRKVVFPFYGVPETMQKWNTRKGTLVTRTYAELFRNQSATLTLTPGRRRAASISKLSRLFREFL